MICDACTPQIDPDIIMRTLEGKTVLEVEVVPGKFRPYYIANKGKETTTYIRINGTSRPADARKLKELEIEGQNLSYDKMLCIGKEYDEKKALHLCKEMKQLQKLFIICILLNHGEREFQGYIIDVQSMACRNRSLKNLVTV